MADRPWDGTFNRPHAQARDEQVEAAPEVAAEVQALDVSDEALAREAEQFIKDHPRPKGQDASASDALEKRINAADPDQVLQALEDLRKEGVKMDSTPDFEERLDKKLEGLPAAPKQAAAADVEPLALGPAELRLCLSFKSFCATSFALAKVAERKAKHYGKMHNGKGDAFKHAYWSALMTLYLTEPWAKALGNAHEARPKNPKRHRRPAWANGSQSASRLGFPWESPWETSASALGLASAWRYSSRKRDVEEAGAEATNRVGEVHGDRGSDSPAVGDGQASSSGRSVRRNSSSGPSGRQPAGGGLARSAFPARSTCALWVTGV